MTIIIPATFPYFRWQERGRLIIGLISKLVFLKNIISKITLVLKTFIISITTSANVRPKHFLGK